MPGFRSAKCINMVTIIAVWFARETKGIDLADVDAADARALDKVSA